MKTSRPVVARTAVLAALALLAMAAPQVAAQEAPPVTGKWQIALETPQGERTIDLDLVQDGEKVTGTFSGPMGGTGEIQDGTFRDGRLSFAIQVGQGQRTILQRFEGTLEGDAVTGEIRMEGGPGGMMGQRRGGQGGQGGQRGQGGAMRARPFTMMRAGG